jgi:hypothetical protein
VHECVYICMHLCLFTWSLWQYSSHTHNRFSKRASWISGQTAMRRMVFFCTQCNIPESSLVTAAWRLTTRSSILVELPTYVPSNVSIGSNSTPACQATEKAMRLELHAQSTSLGKSCITTPGHIPHGVVGLSRARTITTVAQLGAYLQAAPADHCRITQYRWPSNQRGCKYKPTRVSHTFTPKRN